MALERLRGMIRAWRDYPLPEGTWVGGRYKIEALLGEGSYGITYRCLDSRTGGTVALKQSRPSKSEMGRALLEQERDVLQAMDHPRIPKCRDYLVYKGRNWLVTDYIEGLTLEELIFGQNVVYGERECLSMTLRLMELVGHVHARGYVHLDLRIPNVIMQGEEMYLIDFGLARRIGEPEQVAVPERRENRPSVQPKRMPPVITSDLYDIGQFMLFMLYSGYEPDPDGMEQGWREELDISPAMLHILERLLGEDNPYSSTVVFIREAEALHENLL